MSALRENPPLRSHKPRGLRLLDTGLWVAESPLRFFVEMGRRMSVVLLPSGGLFVHSPVDLTPGLRAQLAGLGDVRFVAPASNLHGHTSMGQYQSAYPDADLFAASGLVRKRPELDFAGELGERADPRWADVLDQTVFRGHRTLDEVVFLHRPTRSLHPSPQGF